MDKRIKDPIYGYITIPNDIINQIIDTPEFQRLRGVIQTSYSSVYPSTLHNRFVHSIGVYHLGKHVSETLEMQLADDIDYISNICRHFQIACLLHDVGHAPFSHTGEAFYLKGNDREELHEKLAELTNDDVLLEEIKNNGYKAAPHEIMSAIIGLEVYGDVIETDERSFFARCITGYKYTAESSDEKEIRNCFIEMLNSNILDVDKLDYLMRDSFMSGFDSSTIDYSRLLDSIRIENVSEKFEIVFSKSALSVVENVVFAHDFERKWIQSHPAVLYDSFLLKRVFEDIIEKHFGEQICLPRELLSQTGSEVEGIGRVRLIADADILFIMKNFEHNETVEEYFDRRKRKHPLWKTESEYHAIFGNNKELLDNLYDLLKELDKSQRMGYIRINSYVKDTIIAESEELKNAIKAETYEKKQLEYSLRIKENQKKLVEIFEKFSINSGIPFEHVIIFADQFNSGFKKSEFGNMNFILPTTDTPCKFMDISNVLKQEDSVGEKFFFIFCDRSENDIMPEFSSFVERLVRLVGYVLSDSYARSAGGRIRN